jgi:hypothetical protein
MYIMISKIKNLLQTNKLIGKIDSIVPLALSNFIDFFLTDLIITSLSLIKRLGKKNLKTNHIKYILKRKNRFKTFLKKFTKDR